LNSKRGIIEGISALLVVVLLLGAAYAYTDNWPPAVIVESKSMQHGNGFTLGVINTGDIVGVKKINNFSQVITYVQARTQGKSINYGDYGDVIVYKNNYLGELVIHRAIMYIEGWKGNTPIIYYFENQSWITINGSNVIIRDVGYAHRNLLIELSQYVGEKGFVTMGDYNLANSPFIINGNTYLAADQNVGIDNTLVNVSQIMGVAVGYIPILGVLKLWITGKTTYIPMESNIVMALVLAAIVIYALIPAPKKDKKDEQKLAREKKSKVNKEEKKS